MGVPALRGRGRRGWRGRCARAAIRIMGPAWGDRRSRRSSSVCLPPSRLRSRSAPAIWLPARMGVVQFSHLVAAGEGPVEELQRAGRGVGRLVLRTLCIRMKVAPVSGQASLPGWLVRIWWKLGPVGAGGGALKASSSRAPRNWPSRFFIRRSHLVLLDVGVLDVADRVGQAPTKAATPSLPLPPAPGGPVHGRCPRPPWPSTRRSPWTGSW